MRVTAVEGSRIPLLVPTLATELIVAPMRAGSRGHGGGGGLCHDNCSANGDGTTQMLT